MSSELLAVIESLEKERGIDRESLAQMVEAAIMSASRKGVDAARDLRVEVDRKTLDIRAYVKAEVVERPRARQAEISLAEARRVKPDAKLGDMVEIQAAPKDFGRIAAQAAKQAIIQRIRQAERDIVLKEYQDRVGDIVSGTILRIERNDLIVDLGRVEAIMPASERVRTEEYQPGDRLRAYVLSVQEHVSGHHIVLSRSHPDFVRRLFELEVSEIADKTVEIKSLAREPGYRTKIAVASRDEKVDPVGACVGMKGGRVKNIVRELLGEKIDIVRWHEDIKTLVTNALSPAKLKRVMVDEAARRVVVVVDPDQLSLTIGKGGQNIRLTAKLVGWKVDIEKDKEEVSFQEKVAQAVTVLAAMPGLDADKAEKLVKAGFLSLEGLVEADLKDLQDIAEIGLETAAALKAAAEEAVARSAAAQAEPPPA
jgi:N utilization substance protein A